MGDVVQGGCGEIGRAQADKTLRGMRWFVVVVCRGNIERDRIDHWQVTVKVGFTLEEA